MPQPGIMTRPDFYFILKGIIAHFFTGKTDHAMKDIRQNCNKKDNKTAESINFILEANRIRHNNRLYCQV